MICPMNLDKGGSSPDIVDLGIVCPKKKGMCALQTRLREMSPQNTRSRDSVP